MPPEIIALIDKPLLLAIVLAVGAACGIATERVGEHLRKQERRAYWERRKRRSGGAVYVGRFKRPSKATPLNDTPERATPDAADQLRIIMEAEFRARPLLNKPERRLLAHLDRALAEEAPGWRAMGQVSLGEILASDDKNAFFAVNSKRVDLLIIDAECRPLHAVEFQGTGHHQGTAAARDAVKKEALRRAGIGYVEIVSGDTPADVRGTVRKLVQRTTQAS